MTIQNIINADFDLASLGAKVTEWYDGFKAEATLAGLLETADKAVTSVLPAVAIAGILLALSLVLALFGKKLLGLQKFFGCLIVGFACGVVYATPWVNGFFAVDAWIVGLVAGVVAALLGKLVYVLAYAAVPALATYTVLMGGYYLPESVTAVTKGNLVVALVGAAVVVLVLFLLRKWVEMLGTAVLGGLSTYVCVNAVLAATMGQILDPNVPYIKLAIVAGVALVGFIVQVKTRKQY